LYPHTRARLRLMALGASAITVGSLLTLPAPARAEDAPVTMSVAGETSKLDYGRRVSLRGRAPSTAAPRSVTIQFAPRGKGFGPIAQVQSAADGSYAFKARAKRSGAYRAVVEGQAPSAAQRITVRARFKARTSEHLKRGERASLSGTLTPSTEGRTVLIEVSHGGDWKRVAKARTTDGGKFKAAWKATRHGRYLVRARFAGDDANAASSRQLGRLNVYRPSHASYYGPGLYGNPVACGGTLTPGRIGVAHKSLPCGTKVTFRNGNRTVTAEVIDRGPYVGGRTWDLTAATKRKLGFGSTGTVWSTS